MYAYAHKEMLYAIEIEVHPSTCAPLPELQVCVLCHLPDFARGWQLPFYHFCRCHPAQIILPQTLLSSLTTSRYHLLPPTTICLPVTEEEPSSPSPLAHPQNRIWACASIMPGTTISPSLSITTLGSFLRPTLRRAVSRAVSYTHL